MDEGQDTCVEQSKRISGAQESNKINDGRQAGDGRCERPDLLDPVCKIELPGLG